MIHDDSWFCHRYDLHVHWASAKFQDSLNWFVCLAGTAKVGAMVSVSRRGDWWPCCAWSLSQAWADEWEQPLDSSTSTPTAPADTPQPADNWGVSFSVNRPSAPIRDCKKKKKKKKKQSFEKKKKKKIDYLWRPIS